MGEGKTSERITIFAGHYGSGKTQLAINRALALAAAGKRAALADMDIVNPYFRSADADALMKSHGVSLIASRFAGSNIDAPSVPSDIRRIFDDRELFAVLDVGGDERGALALGRFADDLAREDYKMLLVINRYRPLSRTPESVAEYRAEIEAAAKIPFSGIINNSNLGAQTTADDIISSADYAEKASELTGLPLIGTAVREDLDIANSIKLKIFTGRLLQW